MTKEKPKVSPMEPCIAQKRSRTSRRQRKGSVIEGRVKKRKLRKLNERRKLEIVHVSTQNSPDVGNMILRLMGRFRSKNGRSRRARAEDILECE